MFDICYGTQLPPYPYDELKFLGINRFRLNLIELLSCLPREVVRYLAKTIATVAISRADAIMEVVDSLPVKTRTQDTYRSSEPPQTITIVEGEEMEE